MELQVTPHEQSYDYRFAHNRRIVVTVRHRHVTLNGNLIRVELASVVATSHYYSQDVCDWLAEAIRTSNWPAVMRISDQLDNEP